MSLDLEFKFSNPLIAMAAGKWFEESAGKQVDALCQRAKAIYA